MSDVRYLARNGPNPGPSVARIDALDIFIQMEHVKLLGGGLSLKRTAIWVVHGMGRQRPFETLGVFSKGLGAALESAPPTPQFIDQHGWHQSAVRLTKQGTDHLIDVYEYYWAPQTEGKITLRAVYWWLIRSALVPYLYITENLRLRADERRHQKRLRSELLRLAFFFFTLVALIAVGVAYLWAGRWMALRGSEFLQDLDRSGVTTSVALMVKAGLGFIHVLALAIWTWLLAVSFGSSQKHKIRALSPLTRWKWRLFLNATFLFLALSFDLLVPFYGPTFLNLLVPATVIAVAFALYRWIRSIMVEYVGDVAIYVSSNAFSAYYDVRKKILDGAVDMLTSILRDDEPQDASRTSSAHRYDEVVVVAHSLGSVIAYDALNRILVQNQVVRADGTVRAVPIQKVRLFVTCGSPLEKIYYFFRERIPEKETIRKAITDLLYPLIKGHTHELDTMQWLNFWTPRDPVSGYLYHYPVTRNIECDDGVPLFAHTRYWEDGAVYTTIADAI